MSCNEFKKKLYRPSDKGKIILNPAKSKNKYLELYLIIFSSIF